jgi:uncharacterized protein YhfF
MDKPRTPEVVAFWNGYRAVRGVPEQDYDVCRMGSSAAMGSELLDLILSGPKRATACLLRDVEQGGEMMARDLRTRTVEVKPLNQVDSALAWDEGEGDRTWADWLAMHKRYFVARAVTEGFTFDESMPAVFERFTVVWPPEHADPEGA